MRKEIGQVSASCDVIIVERQAVFRCVPNRIGNSLIRTSRVPVFGSRVHTSLHDYSVPFRDIVQKVLQDHFKRRM